MRTAARAPNKSNPPAFRPPAEVQTSQYPNSEEELTSFSSFVTEFADDTSNPTTKKYPSILREVANHEATVVRFTLDDILAVIIDLLFDLKQGLGSEIMERVKKNAVRYVKLLQKICDGLMPRTHRRVDNEDTLDILSMHRNVGDGVDSSSPPQLLRRHQVLLTSLDKDKPVRLRDLHAANLGGLVKIKAMVTRVSDIRPLATVLTYTCELCSMEIYQEIVANQFGPLETCPNPNCPSVKHKSASHLALSIRSSKFCRFQEMMVQELSSQVSQGHLPRSITIQAVDSLVGQCKAGDIVVLSGIYLPSKTGSPYLSAQDIFVTNKGYDEMKITDDELYDITSSVDVLDRLSRSIAPEIFGHDDLKKCLLLQLVGGVSLEGSMKIRGDINILLVGDPGLAKSQLLKHISQLAPKSIYSTGRGSSSVGLTAAVVRDPMTGDLSLEGGALVIADEGICCLDEFDKMNEYDRTAIHEAMEQQTVTIAKAGIVTSLPSRTSVLAAANPIYGRYNRKKSISDNIGLPNSLISRFDLLFLIIDKADYETDLALARHIGQVHASSSISAVSSSTCISPSILKAYLALAKKSRPVMPSSLIDYISEAYVNMRQQQLQENAGYNQDQTSITARQLTSIIRLSQALAKLRLSSDIDYDDVNEAIRLIHSSKSSLFDGPDDARNEVVSDFKSAIFSFISSSSSRMVSDLEAALVRKGFTSQQLQETINEYAALGVLAVNDDRSMITMM